MSKGFNESGCGTGCGEVIPIKYFKITLIYQKSVRSKIGPRRITFTKRKNFYKIYNFKFGLKVRNTRLRYLKLFM